MQNHYWVPATIASEKPLTVIHPKLAPTVVAALVAGVSRLFGAPALSS